MFIINKCKQPNLKKIGTNDLWSRNNIYIYYFTIKNIPITTITFYHSNWYLLRNKFISNKKKKKKSNNFETTLPILKFSSYMYYHVHYAY